MYPKNVCYSVIVISASCPTLRPTPFSVSQVQIQESTKYIGRKTPLISIFKETEANYFLQKIYSDYLHRKKSYIYKKKRSLMLVSLFRHKL